MFGVEDDLIEKYEDAMLAAALHDFWCQVSIFVLLYHYRVETRWDSEHDWNNVSI